MAQLFFHLNNTELKVSGGALSKLRLESSPVNPTSFYLTVDEAQVEMALDMMPGLVRDLNKRYRDYQKETAKAQARLEHLAKERGIPTKKL